jgi:hypothetical protein
VIQEALFGLRNSILGNLLAWINEHADFGRIWSRCLPMFQLLNILKKYIHDYGMFAKLYEKIRGFISGLMSSWSLYKEKDIVGLTRDIEFLRWLRELLIKLKMATLAFDLCVDYSLEPNDNKSDNTSTLPNDYSFSNIPSLTEDVNQNGIPNERSDALSLSDGTIAVSGDKDMRSRLSKDSIINFGVKYLGYPREVMENAWTKVSSSDMGTVLGDDSSNLERCPGFSRAAQILGFRRGL